MGSTMDETYGAMFIGALYSFQGVLTVQAYIYYESFPDDLCRTKILVAIVWCGATIPSFLKEKSDYLLRRLLDVTHLILICQSCYHYLVTNWGNGPALLISTHELDLHLIFVGIATLVCQGFFLHRIWVFSKRNWILTGVLTAACVAAFAVEVLLSAQILQVPSVAYFSAHTGEVIALFSLGGAVDVAIALVLVFYLQQGRTHFDRTNFVVAQVVHYTVATGLATSVLAVACLAAAMHFSLGRLYTNALLATLNSRRNLRQATQVQRSPPSFTIMTTRVITVSFPLPNPFVTESSMMWQSTVDEEFPMSPRSVKDFPPPRPVPMAQ
ncbi:hypothetical protein B0H14DRAFT_2337620 [Mycena olivaceomarginata]|nr:hypothetical protein B0H14DRAFT_2337620 [Mycena olivaceomarginata]